MRLIAFAPMRSGPGRQAAHRADGFVVALDDAEREIQGNPNTEGGDKMHARVTTFHTEPARREEGTRMVEDEVIPAVRKMDGLRGAWWLANSDGTRVIAVSFWDSVENLRASDQAVRQFRDRAQESGSTLLSVEEYEVVAEA